MPKKVQPAAQNAGGQGAGDLTATTPPTSGAENTPGHEAASNPAGPATTGQTGDGAPTGAPADDNVDTSAGKPSAFLEAAVAALAARHMGEQVPALKVTAHRDGYRRGDRAWSKKPTMVKLSEFNEEQLDQLRLDPNVSVQGVYTDAETAGEQQ
ncbi:MAG: hypothetical protein H7Z39_10530 [Burkholderiaceae bacterium]|nr:hypothetical protein [Burkholderiaceae bacterium]